MKQKTKQQPIILLIENYAEENSFIKNWLELNNLTTRETADVFDALEEITDFTVRRCADVFMMPVETSLDKDLARVKALVDAFSETDKIAVMSVSGRNRAAQNSSRRFAATEANLNALLPGLANTAVNTHL
jgi:CheY-like chemotaxis protein